MKKLYFLVVVLVLFVVGSVKGQVINLPDSNFKAKLLQASPIYSIAKDLQGVSVAIDTNNNGEIEEEEALQIGYLTLSQTTITDLTGIEYFTNLKELRCGGLGLNALEISPLEQLEVLWCDDNNITTLNLNSLISLKEIYCQQNQLVALNVDQLLNLTDVVCSNNLLTEIEVNSSLSLDYFFGHSNQFTSLDFSGLSNLQELIVSENNLMNLNLEGCTGLYLLHIDVNPIQTLDISDCTGLVKFGAVYNEFTSLDFSGLTLLQDVRCESCGLQSINLQGCIGLEYLYLSDNDLTTIDLNETTSLIYTDLSNNYSLESLFIKNGKNSLIDLENNYSLKYVCTDDNRIAYYQNIIDDLQFYQVSINSYCSFTPGGNHYTINGTNTLDSNNNGCDTSDISLPNLKFNITNGTQTGSLISNASGEYSIPVSAGTHTITPVLENPSFFTISPSTVNVTFPNQASPSTQNFCVTPVGFHWDIDVNIIAVTPAVPGFDAQYKIIYRNIGNVSVTSGSISLDYNDEVLDLTVASPDSEVLPVGSLYWSFQNLQPFETRIIDLTFNLNTPMETPPLNGGDVLTFQASSSIGTGFDENPSDNVMNLQQVVVNSFDPNDKTCLEGTAITPDMIGKYVHYMIRFENTGTFAAQNIVVKDMIDTTKFDVSSLIALSGSHSYVTRIKGNKVEFIFEGINLPFDDANNDGYVVFKIKTLPTLALGDSFSNTASIYFDFNHPIVTEPAVTTFAVLGTEDFVFNNYFTIYPNPTNNILNITSKQAIELQSISIYNVLGQMVVSVPNAKGVSNVDVSNLSTGNYFIKVVSDKGTSNSKFIKE